jgi:hypothetical protein
LEAVTKFSNLQLELLKLYQNNITEQDLIFIKKFLSNYFANKATEKFDEFILQNNISIDTVNNWSKEHLRTTY